ncbi:uncharacterized protein LOC143349755 [Colletes latitarsis]|uniref:uncharacterized protein LOC143349755 n=1 Tax=Colletes latitarsis TaxID=2605962 RepID=UPI004036AA45
MEERYAAMERELMRTKMLVPAMTRNTIPVHRMSQTDVNWKECSLAKNREYSYGTPSGNQGKNLVNTREIRNQERMNVSSRKKNYNARKNKDSTNRILDNVDWTKRQISSQHFQDDMYPIKDPSDHTCGPRTLNNNSNMVCSTHNVAVILPQESTHSAIDHFKTNNGNHKGISKCDSIKMVGNSKKSFTPFKTQKPTLMEACQRFDKKHEPETSYFIDFDAKHKDHTQASSTVNTPKFQPIMGPEFNKDICERKFEVERQGPNTDLVEKYASKRTKVFENTDTRRKENSRVNQTFQSNRGHWSSHSKKFPYEKPRFENDQSRNFTRNIRPQNRIPTPRSNVHTASTPMIPSTSNPLLDPNGLTIQLLKLAVLLYAPALMPALNLLIARQSSQTSISVPCYEASNDLLTQVFRILNSQQRVPNLPYAPTSRVDEYSSQSRTETNLPDTSSLKSETRYENSSNQLRVSTNTENLTSDRHEQISIAINTSLESCICHKLSSVQCSKCSLCEQVEENQEDNQEEMFA